MIAGNDKMLTLTQLRSLNHKTHHRAITGMRRHLQMSMVHTKRQSRRVEPRGSRHVHPHVVDLVRRCFQHRELEPVRIQQPLAPGHMSPTAHTIIIIYHGMTFRMKVLESAAPMTVVGSRHAIDTRLMISAFALDEDVEHEFLSRDRVVFDIEFQFHMVFDWLICATYFANIPAVKGCRPSGEPALIV